MRILMLLLAAATLLASSEATHSLFPALQIGLSLGSTFLRNLARLKEEFRNDFGRHAALLQRRRPITIAHYPRPAWSAAQERPTIFITDYGANFAHPAPFFLNPYGHSSVQSCQPWSQVPCFPVPQRVPANINSWHKTPLQSSAPVVAATAGQLSNETQSLPGSSGSSLRTTESPLMGNTTSTTAGLLHRTKYSTTTTVGTATVTTPVSELLQETTHLGSLNVTTVTVDTPLTNVLLKKKLDSLNATTVTANTPVTELRHKTTKLDALNVTMTVAVTTSVAGLLQKGKSLETFNTTAVPVTTPVTKFLQQTKNMESLNVTPTVYVTTPVTGLLHERKNLDTLNTTTVRVTSPVTELLYKTKSLDSLNETPTTTMTTPVTQMLHGRKNLDTLNVTTVAPTGPVPANVWSSTLSNMEVAYLNSGTTAGLVGMQNKTEEDVVTTARPMITEAAYKFSDVPAIPHDTHWDGEGAETLLSTTSRVEAPGVALPAYSYGTNEVLDEPGTPVFFGKMLDRHGAHWNGLIPHPSHP